MVIELVGEALLSSSFQLIFEKIISPDVVNFFSEKKLDHRLLKKMRIVLLSVSPMIGDAENKQIRNPHVKAWHEELKEVISDADQLLDEINTEVLRCKIEGEFKSSTSKRLKLASFSFVNRGKTNEIESKMEDILERLEFLVKQKDLLGLEAGVLNRPLQRLPGPLVEQSIVYGRDIEKEKIIDWLLANDINGEKICVVSIVGMGGIGKTTLVQLIYDDNRVKENFDLKMWITVSDEFDILKITAMMLEILTFEKPPLQDLYQLQVKLKQTLMRKKFLLVLDDVWNENYNLWDVLKSPLESGAHGSKIILTTRNQNVASMMGSSLTYNLQGLPNEECWRLFSKHAFSNIHEHADMQEIGREIVGKCQGHPLAIKTLAGVLRTVRNPKEWRNILQNDVWELQLQENSRNNILPALWLSYHYLPTNLKRCFAYCSIFPKGYEIQEEEVILLWMAEGLLQSEKGKTIEGIGKEYFQDLISRSFFQLSIQDESTITMHDLVHHLAAFVAGESCFTLECDNVHEIPEKVRHLSYMCVRYGASPKFDPLYRAKALRTFLPLKLSSSESFLPERVLDDLLPSLRCLRTLSLSHYSNVTKLPYSIGNLKHLRYLDLSDTSIKILPSSITTLYNLQTLKLSNCSCLTRLPSDLGRLVNLRHLYVDGTSLKEMPEQMSRLNNLHILTTFFLGNGRGSDIKELKHLGNLHGKLSVSGLENVVCPEDAQGANFKDKRHLEELGLKWNIDSVKSSSALEILEKLRPHMNLRKLTIENYGGKQFPGWLGDSSFTNIVFLSLANCMSCYLPPVGQLPSLKELLIMGLPKIEEMGRDFYGSSWLVQPFRSLEILKIEDMAELKDWHVAVGEKGSGSFPCLRELHIGDCPRLTGNLPPRLPCLIELVIVGCQKLEVSLPEAPALCQLEVIHCGKILLENIPAQLHLLTIVGVGNMEFLLREIDYKNTSLEGLNISGCLSLKRILEGGFPATLKTVEITNCRNLELYMHQSYASLESLTVYNSCDSLKSFPLDLFPRLNRLHLDECSNLESLSHSGELDHIMTFLNFLQISRCPKFVSFPKGGLPAPNLKWLWVEGCPNLESFPEKMHLLSSLEDLYISECPGLDSFPKGGLPLSLHTLSIFCCERLISNQMMWNLSSLSSLEYFSIGCNCENLDGFPSGGYLSIEQESLEGFLQEGQLPSSLTSLHIVGLANLNSLEIKGLQCLTSLKELKISKCYKLESIPIEDLPSSLEFIQITNCPLLKKKYQAECGRDLARIARNVCIQLDNEVLSCQ